MQEASSGEGSSPTEVLCTYHFFIRRYYQLLIKVFRKDVVSPPSLCLHTSQLLTSKFIPMWDPHGKLTLPYHCLHPNQGPLLSRGLRGCVVMYAFSWSIICDIVTVPELAHTLPVHPLPCSSLATSISVCTFLECHVLGPLIWCFATETESVGEKVCK